MNGLEGSQFVTDKTATFIEEGIGYDHGLTKYLWHCTLSVLHIFVIVFSHVIAGGISSSVFLLGTIITTAVVSYKHEYQAQQGPGVPAP